MSKTTELSEAKRALLDKYLRGDLSRLTTASATIPRRAAEQAAPLSFAQQQMWLLAQLIPETPVYNESVTLHLPGALDVAILEQSFSELLRRHEAWRTSFPLVAGQPVQLIHPPVPQRLPVVDLRHLPAAEREAEALRLATQDAQEPFDLVAGPLLRPRLVQFSESEHRLYLSLHHIIFDGITIYQVFLPELRSLYEAFARGEPSPLPELPIQYADFAAWQREHLQEDAFADQLAFWKQHLQGAPTTLELPTDHPRPPLPSYRGAIQTCRLSKELSDALRALSSQEASTLYMTLTAAFSTFLARYSGQEDILIGTASGGRTQAEVQSLMGVFINSLLMRTNLSGNPSFRQLLKRVRQETVEVTAHQEVPFEYLVKELQPEREAGQNPFFQVLLLLEPSPPTLPSGWRLTHMEVHNKAAKFDLSLVLEDRPEGLLGRFEYSTDLFDAETIERLIGHWQTLLEGIVANPDQPISELPLLTSGERYQLLFELNDTQIAYPKEQCVHQLFESQVERTPDAVAVAFEGEHLTYRELNERANQLAHRLQKLGVGPEVLVGLCLDRSLAMVVGLLGILKAGGAYVPLDARLPQERLAFMLAETKAPVLLTQRKLAGALPAHTAEPIYLDEWELIAQESKATPVSGVQPGNLAYVIYTSGSTGNPKGVMIEHSSVVNLALALSETIYAQQRAPLRVSLNAPLAFDSSVKQIVQLLFGHTLYILPEEVRLDGSALLAFLGQNKIDVLDCTPIQLKFLLSAGLAERSDVAPALVLVGGEALDQASWQVLTASSRTLYYNVYGPTECTVDATICKMQPPVKESIIGRPLPNVQIYILDRQGQPVPIGVPGELHIGGAGLARGYLNHPELTAEKFIIHSLASSGTRLYRTGDLARYRADGTIEFLGRLDHQVKIRGFRIELGEIETILARHPQVRESVVVVQKDTAGEKRLVAYLVAAQGQSPTINSLRTYLEEKLPNYMVPSAFVLLEALPLTSNGKIDRRALPAPEPAGRAEEDTFVAPILLVHHQLVQIWEELLDVRPIGIRDNFFSLGGHSLLAARMVARIEQVCGKKLPISTLYAGATIEHLAEVLQKEEDTSVEKETNSRTRMVVVQAGKSRLRPFFFLHGDWYGGGFYCLNLARALDSDQPFYALEPYDFDRQAVPPTLEEMAAAHIAALRAVQPEGPYLLGGFCNGALMVYEMARQLRAAGQKIDFLLLIDVAMPHSHQALRSAINRIGRLMRLDQRTQFNLFLRYIYLRIPAYRKKVQETLVEQKELRRKNERGDLSLARLEALFPTVKALRYQWSGFYRWVTAGYLPGIYPGKITFFWSSEAFSKNVDWRSLSGAAEVEEHIFPGTHMSSKNENLHVLAERLNICLRNVE